MQRKMDGRAHIRLEISKFIRNTFVREHEPDDMDVGAARETEYDDIRHGKIPFP
jgi:hypothetical protein